MRINCAGPECKNFMEAPEGTAMTKYICMNCCPDAVLSEIPSFQKYAFDPELGTSWLHRRGIGELRTVIDGDELGPHSKNSGMQIKYFRSGYEKEIPEWARVKENIQGILLTAFPKLHTNVSQRKRAGRWAQVITLYYLQGWSVPEVAEELNEDPRVIMRLTLSISRTAKGLTVDGKPRK